MNKKSIWIAGLAVGFSLAIAGVGAALGASNAFDEAPIAAVAKEDDSHDFAQDLSQQLNNNASISGINIAAQNYRIKKIVITCRYNKDIDPAVTISATVGGESVGESITVGNNFNGTKTFDLSESPKSGAVSLSFENNCGSGSGKGTFYVTNVALVEAAPAAAERPITAISSVALSKDSVPANYGKTITATATFTPNDTDELIEWTSSDEKVATIAASATNGIANITVVGEGECHFTASNQDGTVSCDSGTFTVTEAVPTHVYEITFTGTGSGTDATSDLGTDVVGKMVGETATITVSAGSKLYNGRNKTLKFSSSSANGSMTLSAGSDPIKAVIVEACAYSGGLKVDDATLSVKVGENDAQSVRLDSSFNYYAFNFETAATNVTFSAINRLYVRNFALVVDSYTADQGAYNFAVDFLGQTASGCAALNAETLATAWSSLSTSYAALDTTYSGAKAAFKATEKNESGTVVEKAAARYDYIVGKYLKALDNKAFTDFADRDPAPVNGLGAIGKSNLTINGANLPLVITVVAASSITAAGGIFLATRRKKR